MSDKGYTTTANLGTAEIPESMKPYMLELIRLKNRETPKKPMAVDDYELYWNGGWRYVCSECGWAIGHNMRDDMLLTSDDNYCPNCGQAIDWKEVHGGMN